MRNLIVSAGLAMVVAQAMTVGWPQAQDIAGSLDAPRAAAEFDQRVRLYVALHRSLEGPVPTVAASDDYATVLAAIDALAEKIRHARKGAGRGEIFTPPVERWFRQRLETALEGCDIDALLASLNEENPPKAVFDPHVNGRWSEDASLGPMPPRLLAALPALPDDLEYRFLDRDLILWDSHADIIVDFIRNALP